MKSRLHKVEIKNFKAFRDFTLNLEGRGVQPDVPVSDTRADLLEQRDAPLRAALEWITRAPRTGEQPSGGNIP